MCNFIKGLFKFILSFVAIVSVLIGVGAVVLAYVFKNDFDEIERKTKEIVQDIESKS